MRGERNIAVVTVPYSFLLRSAMPKQVSVLVAIFFRQHRKLLKKRTSTYGQSNVLIFGVSSKTHISNKGSSSSASMYQNPVYADNDHVGAKQQHSSDGYSTETTLGKAVGELDSAVNFFKHI